MIDRVNRYYQLPCSVDMLKHFRNEIGLTGDYVRIFDDLRENIGSTQSHADSVCIPIKTYNAMTAIVGQTCIWELVRLAEIGLKSERNQYE